MEQEQKLKTIGKGALVVGGAMGIIVLGGLLYILLIVLAVIIWVAWTN
ncbi:MAG TPA: hypothetical protein VJA18_02405 [Candidatus Nanoarchaeia archaeon]|nr:hypothetical protein [Candidatus Nanoarchaeia archaeon]